MQTTNKIMRGITRTIVLKEVKIGPSMKKFSAVFAIHKDAVKKLNDPAYHHVFNLYKPNNISQQMNAANVPSFNKMLQETGLELRTIQIVDSKCHLQNIKVICEQGKIFGEGEIRLVFDGKEVSLETSIKEKPAGKPIVQPVVRSGSEVIKKEIVLRGRPASFSLGIGRAYVPSMPDIAQFQGEKLKTPEEVQNEVELAQKAFSEIAAVYLDIKSGPRAKREAKEIASKVYNIIELSGPEIITLIKAEKIDLKMALDMGFMPMINSMRESGDEKQIGFGQELQLVYNKLIFKRHNVVLDMINDIHKISRDYKGEKIVLVCDRVDFVEVASIDPTIIAGIVEEKGGIRSHTTITCKAEEIPLVIGAPEATKAIKNGDVVIVDGEKGSLFVNPSTEKLEKFERLIKDSQSIRKHLRHKYRSDVPLTKDGVRIKLYANTKSDAENERMNMEGKLNGIGLVRTEEFMDIQIQDGQKIERTKEPTLKELIDFYVRLYNTSSDKEFVVFRTMDVNGDKYISYFKEPVRKENGQSLMEGIELCLDGEHHKLYYDLFRDQVKAILMAAHICDVKNPIIEFPMVKNIDVFKKAKEAVEKFEREMKKDKWKFAQNVRLYSMIEHPNAARQMEELAAIADGFSFGSNDFTMKLLFEDRYSAGGKFNEMDPRVLSEIERTADIAKKHKKHFLVCGDMASDPISVVVLFGLGVREFSVEASSVNVIKSIISNIDVDGCKKLTKEIKEIKTAEEVRVHAIKFLEKQILYGDHPWEGMEELIPILRKYAQDPASFGGVPEVPNGAK